MCRYCLKDWLPAIEANRKNVDYTKGEIIFKEGEKVKGIYFIDKGSVKIYKHWTDEKELIVRFAKEGDIFGHRGLGSDDVYPVSATALEPLRVCYIEMSFFESSLKVNHEFLYELMQFFATQLKDSEKNMRNMAHMPVKGRVANALIKLKNSFGENEAGFIRLPIARQDIASYARL